MGYCFPDNEVEAAKSEFGHFAVSAVKSGGVTHRKTGRTLVKPGQVEAVIFSLHDLTILGTSKKVTLQLRIIPYNYPEEFPTFYLISPKSYRLVPDVYKRMKPYPAIQQSSGSGKDDPRNLGWNIDPSLCRVHFCQLETHWDRRPKKQRNLSWALGQLWGLLRNPMNV